jgi:hypothetical protein
MSVLPAGQPLDRFLPDLDDLLHDPRAYLRAGPVVIGPRRMYGLAALFGLPGLAFLVSCAAAGPGDGERLALGAALLIGAAVWFFWSVALRGHSLVLSADGIEVRYLDTAVWGPWALFNADGEPFVPEGDSPRVGLTLPVAPEAIPFVELRRHDSPVAYGASVRGRQWQFAARDEVVLPARYEVRAGDLGQLLLQLGRRLGRELPRGAPPRDAYEAPVREEIPAAPGPGGWITARLTRLVLPPVCCMCGQGTGSTMPFGVQGGWDRMTGFFVQPVRPLELSVPVCEGCRQRLREEAHRGGVRGTLAGGLLLLGLAVIVCLQQGDPGLLLPLAVGGVAVGGIVGFLVGTTTSWRPPVELTRYSPSRGTVAVRFRNPDYAALVLEAMQARARRG